MKSNSLTILIPNENLNFGKWVILNYKGKLYTEKLTNNLMIHFLKMPRKSNIEMKFHLSMRQLLLIVNASINVETMHSNF